MAVDHAKVIWLDTCHECTKQKPLQKKMRCEIWFAVASNAPTADQAMQMASNELGSCKYYEPKIVK